MEEKHKVPSPPPDKGEKTAIIATLGPASAGIESVRALCEAGATIFRLNFSHGTHEDHRCAVEAVRQAGREKGLALGIIADLQGPKLRLGDFTAGRIDLHPGMAIRLDLDETPGDGTRVCFPHPDIIAALRPGARLVLDDGAAALRVTQTGAGHIDAVVEYGRELSNRKGVSAPDLAVPVPALTGKDLADLAFALSLGVDAIAVSFVQSAADVETAKALVSGRALLIAKIEKPAAVADLPAIIAAADAVMLARGDLGVELPLERVPVIQKQAAHMCKQASKPFIIATQMLESMRESERPTRAEVSDVAQAVFDGAAAVMLSAETAVGRHPALAVEMMARICREAETVASAVGPASLASLFAAVARRRETSPAPVRYFPPSP